MKKFLEKVLRQESLAREEAIEAVGLLRKSSIPSEQKGAFLIALRMKGESSEELAGFAEALLQESIQVRPQRTDLVDTCGTGGDGSNTFNISTAAAFVVAAAGLGVAKHGNRSISSRC